MVSLAQSGPPKRSFAEIEEDEGEEPNSDELYGWIEDDEVATEELLINEAPDTDIETADPRSRHTAEITMRQSNKIARFTTI